MKPWACRFWFSGLAPVTVLAHLWKARAAVWAGMDRAFGAHDPRRFLPWPKQGGRNSPLARLWVVSPAYSEPDSYAAIPVGCAFAIKARTHGQNRTD